MKTPQRIAGIHQKALRRIIAAPGYSLVELIIAILYTTIAFPFIAGIFVQALNDSHNAELTTIAQMLAQEEVEIILANKAGTGAGYGYANITSAAYTSVNPAAPYNSFTRTVTIASQNLMGSASYPAKVITVRVSNPSIPTVVLTAFILDHSAL